MKLLLLLSITSLPLYAQTWIHQGPPAQIIELFTSEGCSSCPPADEFLSELNDSNALWEDVIPVAFHVDYWDYLGWQDPYAQPSFTLRQQLYRKYGVVNSVYTPSFVVDGQEWRGFFNWLDRELPDTPSVSAKPLVMSLHNNEVTVEFAETGTFDLTLLLIANERISYVKAGENKGKELKHNFVVLEQHQQRSNDSSWSLELTNNEFDTIAAWVTTTSSFKPVQTVAGNVSKEQ
ncbi:DUF1223 domain-containing protein [Vibrio profundi]|uniref:DUF1223 domain-containing protein n=1 Tax=Vibrio profundi TaxID=1774960 RepID=UPI00373696D8